MAYRKLTEYIKLHGLTKWFRPSMPNQWARWSHVLYPDEASMDIIWKLKERGIKNTIGKDEDGYYITISRPIEREFKGKKQGFNPPEILMADGMTPLKDIYVGNGSEVTTKVEVYPYSIPGKKDEKGLAMRWLATRVDNLVPYESATRDDAVVVDDNPLDKDFGFQVRQQKPELDGSIKPKPVLKPSPF